MGALLDCLRDSNDEQKHQSGNVRTPDAVRRQQLCAARFVIELVRVDAAIDMFVLVVCSSYENQHRYLDS
jgi:hypothetical protein